MKKKNAIITGSCLAGILATATGAAMLMKNKKKKNEEKTEVMDIDENIESASETEE